MILYSYRRCPYAMRARMALFIAHIQCEVHEIDFKNKPQAMLEVSPKATVPVLVKMMTLCWMRVWISCCGL